MRDWRDGRFVELECRRGYREHNGWHDVCNAETEGLPARHGAPVTAPEKAIAATKEALKTSGAFPRTIEKLLLEQVLANQLVLLRATAVHLSWSDE